MTKRVRFWWPKSYLKMLDNLVDDVLCRCYATKEKAELIWGKGNVVQLEIREVGDGKNYESKM